MKDKSKHESHDDDEHSSDEHEEEEAGEPDSATIRGSEDEEDGPEPLIKPVERSIGEGRDNLRQREGWFRRRSGTPS
ncbi:MAG TPA: hypothetical protein VF553_01695 [Pyrinomonadaceae bacterium]|jgi:hypothetical protein